MKRIIPLALMVLCAAVSAAVLVFEAARTKDYTPDMTEINRIKVTTESAEDFSEIPSGTNYDFTVISSVGEARGEVLFSTVQTDNIAYTERINTAVKNGDTIIDYEKDGASTGKIIIYTGAEFIKGRTLRLFAVSIPFAAFCVLCFLYYFYMRRYLYGPFLRMKSFAKDIAAGNLDLPLPMDKGNLFGDFTESFDLMREELKTAKEKAAAEEKSKKELIASLGHDIKTPVAIVRAAAELLEIGETDNKKLANIKAVQAKASEIDSLITDLFSSALDDLSELKVSVRDMTSFEAEKLILSADTLNKTVFVNAVPECLIKGDPLRLSQIFGNIISNSYKYADTKISVDFVCAGGFLKIAFTDCGKTLDKNELTLLTSKFYRGKNSKERHGAGLGLYICSKLAAQMGGSFDLDLVNGGLKAEVRLALS